MTPAGGGANNTRTVSLDRPLMCF